MNGMRQETAEKPSAFLTRSRRRTDYPDRTARERQARYQERQQVKWQKVDALCNALASALDRSGCWRTADNLPEEREARIEELTRRLEGCRMVAYSKPVRKKRDPKPPPAALSPKAREVLRWLATWGPSTDSRLVASLVACGWNASTPRVRRADLTALGLVRAAGRLVNETLWEVTEAGRRVLANQDPS